jgi:hypothetical protein
MVMPAFAQPLPSIDGVRTPNLLPGGEFTALQETDGTWTIKAVPILAEMEPGRRSNEKKIDGAWMLAAIARHAQLERDNRHLAAVHELHHDPGVVPTQIGFLRLSHVGRLRLNGKDQDVLFADIVRVRQYDLDRMQELELPFRSIEISRTWKPEIASLALMATEAPEHKLPMLTLGDVVPSDEFENQPIALVETGDRVHLQFGITGATNMADAPKKPDELEEDGASDATTDMITKVVSEYVSKTLPDMIKSALEGAGSGGDAPAADLADDDTSPAETDDEDDMAEDDDDDEKDDDKNSGKNAKMRGEIAALKKVNADRDKVDAKKAAVDAACEKLRESGREVDKATRKDIVALADESKNPAKSCMRYAESYLRTVPEDPPEDVEALGARGLLDGTESIDSLSDEVKAYREQGPEKLARAAEKGREFDELKKNGMHFSISRKDYIELNMDDHVVV